MATQQTSITPEMTINEITQRSPKTLPVLNGFGLDTCCGGPLSLEEAARRHGLDLAELLASLEAAR